MNGKTGEGDEDAGGEGEEEEERGEGRGEGEREKSRTWVQYFGVDIPSLGQPAQSPKSRDRNSTKAKPPDLLTL
jgi:hypothetical protein